MAGLDSVEVHVDLETMAEPALMGTLHRQRSGKGELFSFEYVRTWIARAEAFAFDPDLALGRRTGIVR